MRNKPERFLTPKEAGEIVGRRPRTMEKYRGAGTGPAYYKIGHVVIYRRADVEEWKEKRTVTSTKARTGPHQGGADARKTRRKPTPER